MSEVRLAITRRNTTLDASPSDAIKPEVKAIGLEFDVSKPGRYEIVLDVRDNSVTLYEVPDSCIPKK